MDAKPVAINDEKKGLGSWVMRSGWVIVEDRGWVNSGRQGRLRGTILPLMNPTWDTDAVLALRFMEDAEDRQGIVGASCL
jgi:hypothetical protein